MPCDSQIGSPQHESDTFTNSPIAHCELGIAFNPRLNTSSLQVEEVGTETNSGAVAVRVYALLIGPASAFGPITFEQNNDLKPPATPCIIGCLGLACQFQGAKVIIQMLQETKNSALATGNVGANSTTWLINLYSDDSPLGTNIFMTNAIGDTISIDLPTQTNSIMVYPEGAILYTTPRSSPTNVSIQIPASLWVGEKQRIRAVGDYENDITLPIFVATQPTSSDPTVAPIDGEVITGMPNGTVTVIAQAGGSSLNNQVNIVGGTTQKVRLLVEGRGFRVPDVSANQWTLQSSPDPRTWTNQARVVSQQWIGVTNEFRMFYRLMQEP